MTRAELENRRIAAAEDLRDGMRPGLVGMKHGVSRTTIARWQRTIRTGGLAKLKATYATGRPRKLTPEQLAEIPALFEAGARTAKQLAFEIEQRFAVRYDPDHILRLMYELKLRQPKKRTPAALVTEGAPSGQDQPTQKEDIL